MKFKYTQFLLREKKVWLSTPGKEESLPCIWKRKMLVLFLEEDGGLI
jgi:hypothetical protein